MTLLTAESRTVRKISIIGIIAVISLGTILTFIATVNGLVIEGDGYYYINAARIIASHLGLGDQASIDKNLLREITSYYAYAMELWPPFYPALLAAASLTADPYPAGRWLHLVFPLIIGSLLWGILYRNQKTHTRAFVAIALIILSPIILRLNFFVYSESLFLILQLLTMLAISYYLRAKRRLWLVMAIIFIALACLTRYIGAAMALALAVTLWRVNADFPLYRRMALSLSCILFSVLPVTLYMFSSIIYGQTLYVAGRSLAWNWPIAKALIFFKKSLNSPVIYLTPEGWPPQIQVFLALLAITAIVIFFVHQVKQQRQQPPARAVLQLQNFIKSCLLIYLVMASLLALFLDHMVCFTGLTPRHFAPVFVWAVVLIALTGPENRAAGTKNSSRFMAVSALIFTAILITGSLAGSTINALKNPDIAEKPNKLWKNSPALAVAQEIDGVPWIVTNMPGEVFHYLNTPVFALPSHYDFFKAQNNPRYQEQMARLRTLLHQHNGIVLYFNPWVYLPKEGACAATSLEECMDSLHLEIYLRSRDCLILRPVS
ncbi:MAG: hypothetical protein AB1724_03855 [Thermodesulfobacteriota bacterium]